jgi:hypothetical protein
MLPLDQHQPESWPGMGRNSQLTQDRVLKERPAQQFATSK